MLTPGPAQPVSKGMTVALTGITAATLDLTRMSMTVEEPVLVTVTGDGEGTLTFAGPWPAGGSVTITRDGELTGTVDVVDGTVTLADDFLGVHDYAIAPRS